MAIWRFLCNFLFDSEKFYITLKYVGILNTMLLKEAHVVAEEQGPSEKCLGLEDSWV